MKALRILCQLVTMLMCFIGLGLAYIGGAMCRAADRLNKVVKL
jgi:hypothetical protein